MIPYYTSPILFQSGRGNLMYAGGLGNVFGKWFSRTVPLIKRLGKAAIEAGTNAGINAVMDGKPIRPALEEAGKDQLRKLVREAVHSSLYDSKRSRKDSSVASKSSLRPDVFDDDDNDNA